MSFKVILRLAIESYLVMTRVLRNVEKSELNKLLEYESHLYVLV